MEVKRVDSPIWMHIVWLTCYVVFLVFWVWAAFHVPDATPFMFALMGIHIVYLFFVALPTGEDIGVHNPEW